MSNYAVVDGCVAPAELMPVLTQLQQDWGGGYASIYRGEDAADLLHSLGKHTQQELYDLYLSGQGAPANRPGTSTHELRSDGVAYAGPSGRTLEWWQCGIDVEADSEVQGFLEAVARRGWSARQPYPSGSEFHHVNFASAPILAAPPTNAEMVAVGVEGTQTVETWSEWVRWFDWHWRQPRAEWL